MEMRKKLHPVPTKESMSAINAEKNGRQYTYRLYNSIIMRERRQREDRVRSDER